MHQLLKGAWSAAILPAGSPQRLEIEMGDMLSVDPGLRGNLLEPRHANRRGANPGNDPDRLPTLKSLVRLRRRVLMGYLLLVLVLLAPIQDVFAQTETDGSARDVVLRMEQAFARGDVQAMLTAAGDRIEIGVLGSGTLYSRAQATFVLESFFKEHPPSRFRTTRTGGSNSNGFVAGRYWYGGGEEHLDVYYRYKCKGSTCEVRELRIERPVR